MSDLAGLDAHKAKETVDDLSSFLGDLFVLYVKVLNFHWNIEGQRFASLHEFLEEQYLYLAKTADGVAERIRVFDEKAPGSMKSFLELATLKEEENTDLDADDMLEILCQDYGQIIQNMRTYNERAPENDWGTHTLYEDLITNFEKTRWMLKSHL